MDEYVKIALTAGFTIFGGVFVYVCGQLVSKFIIEPIHDFKKLLGEIRYTILFHKPELYTAVAGDKERCDKAHEAFRKASSDLVAKADAVPFYDRLAYGSRGFLPRKTAVEEAAKWLRNLSSAVYKDDRSDNYKVVAKVYDSLAFGPLDD